jgi:DNA-binding PadR family transcriptional regulator
MGCPDPILFSPYMYMVYTWGMSTAELHLAVLAVGPRHGYEVKKEHDAWFPETRQVAYGQVYATLSRLVRDGLAEVVETRREGGPERTVYAVTDAGRDRLRQWLAEPAAPAGAGGEEVVRKVVVALRLVAQSDGVDAALQIVVRQRTSYLRRMRSLQEHVDAGGDEVAGRLARRHAVLHLDADLRWLDEVGDVLGRLAARAEGGGGS